MIYRSESFKQTKNFALEMAKEILLRREIVGPTTPTSVGLRRRVPAEASGKTKFRVKDAVILALKGNLGSGKTTFTQGFLKGLGIRKKITSPTFVIQKNYRLRTTHYRRAYHIDCYRIKKSQELLILGIKEIFDNPKNIILIEWPEKIKNILPKERFNLKFEYGEKENERRIIIG